MIDSTDGRGRTRTRHDKGSGEWKAGGGWQTTAHFHFHSTSLLKEHERGGHESRTKWVQSGAADTGANANELSPGLPSRCRPPPHSTPFCSAYFTLCTWSLLLFCCFAVCVSACWLVSVLFVFLCAFVFGVFCVLACLLRVLVSVLVPSCSFSFPRFRLRAACSSRARLAFVSACTPTLQYT